MLLDIRDKLQTATLASWFLQYPITERNFRLGLRRALRQTRHPPHSSHRWFRAWSTDRDSRKASSIVMSKKNFVIGKLNGSWSRLNAGFVLAFKWLAQRSFFALTYCYRVSWQVMQAMWREMRGFRHGFLSRPSSNLSLNCPHAQSTNSKFLSPSSAARTESSSHDNERTSKWKFSHEIVALFAPRSRAQNKVLIGRLALMRESL